MSEERFNEEDEIVEEIVEGEAVAEPAAEVLEGEFVETEAAEVAPEPTPEELLAAAKEEAAQHLDNYLRAQAELSNARKRFEKQRAITYVNANADMVSKLLPVLDDYERALDTVPEAVSEDAWYQGIQLVYRKLLGVLEAMGVAEIEAINQPFDPHVHEALGQEPSDEVESGNVSRVMQKGYQIGDRVVRPALVYVAE